MGKGEGVTGYCEIMLLNNLPIHCLIPKLANCEVHCMSAISVFYRAIPAIWLAKEGFWQGAEQKQKVLFMQLNYSNRLQVGSNQVRGGEGGCSGLRRR